MNYMEQVAKMFGVGINEVFDVERLDGSGFEYGVKLTEYGLIDSEKKIRNILLALLLVGRLLVKKRPWKPRLGKKFLFVNVDGVIDWKYWCNNESDIALLAFGNVFKLKEEITDEIKQNLIQKMEDVMEDKS